jgi:Na+-translocating ferredoxin:NAD+ oxidoreductase RnfD subunit
MGTWVFGAVMGVLSLVGLFVASRAHDQALYWAGLVVFAAGVAVIFWLIAKHTGHPTRQGGH